MNSSPQNRIEVPVSRLDIGMYVAELDRPWLDTPFALQGFYIRTREDVETLSEYCEFVYVDPRRLQRDAALPKARARYKNTVTMKTEFTTAQTDLESAHVAISKVFERLSSGAPLEVAAVSRAINPLIDSVLRNKDAMAALMRIRKKDDYTYGHCLASAAWAAILGRHLGFDTDTLKTLALGAALTDVGKVRVDSAILAKTTTLSAEELEAVRAHVDHSIEIVRDAKVEPEVIEIVQSHHERHDGSGYHAGLVGAEIPLLARIAGLADSYDAMITTRPYAAARSSYQAMQELSDLKDKKFQGELVEQFMQAIGLFPTGSLVELNTGEVGIVAAQNASRRLKPTVMVILAANKQRLKKFNTIDLTRSDTSDGRIWISKELAPGSHGIDAEEFYL
jgi:HD-GYP domain-containing protein (c-di-GMP phosphodiesterase class II)